MELAIRILALLGMFAFVYGGLFVFAWYPAYKHRKQEQEKSGS
jgi:hypothetical protein